MRNIPEFASWRKEKYYLGKSSFGTFGGSLRSLVLLIPGYESNSDLDSWAQALGDLFSRAPHLAMVYVDLGVL